MPACLRVILEERQRDIKPSFWALHVVSRVFELGTGVCWRASFSPATRSTTRMARRCMTVFPCSPPLHCTQKFSLLAGTRGL